MQAAQIFPADGPTGTAPPSRTHPPDRILVVEDDVLVRQLNATVLLHSGYAVDTAEDGAAAWDAVHAHRYDLVITDNNMPNLTGIALVKMLRDENLSLPVIMATGALPTGELDPKPQCHLTTLLLKPYTIVELLARVHEVLAAARNANPATENRNRDDPRGRVRPGP